LQLIAWAERLGHIFKWGREVKTLGITALYRISGGIFMAMNTKGTLYSTTRNRINDDDYVKQHASNTVPRIYDRNRA